MVKPVNPERIAREVLAVYRSRSGRRGSLLLGVTRWHLPCTHAAAVNQEGPGDLRLRSRRLIAESLALLDTAKTQCKSTARLVEQARNVMQASVLRRALGERRRRKDVRWLEVRSTSWPTPTRAAADRSPVRRREP
jgi:hypothetical protein